MNMETGCVRSTGGNGFERSFRGRPRVTLADEDDSTLRFDEPNFSHDQAFSLIPPAFGWLFRGTGAFSIMIPTQVPLACGRTASNYVHIRSRAT
ncbi:hypothetical protein TcasGA2_TC012693 [Tribolium castaneum]|uniref:Uncharacterized protein n=1 Tax=Tribolium castaneum TaxID=7070 RepID=D6WZM0_TRICA|nr:hypothetical protein TcasGA2_TC012693 [Tribolium castaneum]